MKLEKGQEVKLGNFRCDENKEISGLTATVVSVETGGSGGHIKVRVPGHSSDIYEDGLFLIHRRNIR